MIAATTERVDRLRSAVVRRLGLAFGEDKRALLADAIAQTCGHGAGATESLVARVETDGESREEWRRLVSLLTVGETYFFRYWDHYRAVADVVFPECAARAGGVRILSAGCASGEEPYSLAILAKERLTGRVEVAGFDVNAEAVERARRGRYSAWSMREAPADLRDRYFVAEGREYVLDPSVRGAVKLEERNLLDGQGALLEERFDLIFCRNLLMYMTPAAAAAIVARLTASLRPGGHLFLGHAETLRGLSDEYHLVHTHGTFYYRLKYDASERVPPSAGVATPAVPGSFPPADLSWMEAIQRASDRIATLAAAPAAESPERREPAPGADPDAMLLRAVVLAHGRDLGPAEDACRRLMAASEMNAGAHYLMALCREHAGDARGAVERDESAAYLDPTFAMPRLHLGMMARRAGEADRARRELSEALALLAREEPARVLLFGGGFSREALASLCRAELRACGGDA